VFARGRCAAGRSRADCAVRRRAPTVWWARTFVRPRQVGAARPCQFPPLLWRRTAANAVRSVMDARGAESFEFSRPCRLGSSHSSTPADADSLQRPVVASALARTRACQWRRMDYYLKRSPAGRARRGPGKQAQV